LTAGKAGTEKAKAAKVYIEWCFTTLVDGIQDFIHHALLSLDYGFQIFEKVYKRGAVYFDGSQFRITNIISRLSPIMPEKFNRFYYDEKGDFQKAEVKKESSSGGYTLIDIEQKDLIWITNNPEYRDIRGRSELRTARLAWQIKQQALIGAGMLKARAAGMPELKISGAVTTEKLASAQELGRTIGNTDQWYAITNDDLTLTLHSPHDQGDNVSFIDMLNRELFYNTLTEFLSSGIGGNGSRAATSEHKTAYELKANMILRSIENLVNSIITEMIDISYLPVLTDAEYPCFQFDAISQVDAGKVAASALSLYSQKILDKRQGDETFFRSILGLPEPTGEVIEVKQEEPVLFKKEIEKKEPVCNHETKKLTINKKLSEKDLKDHIEKVFSLESATEHYMDTAEKVDDAIRGVLKKVWKDIAQQLEKNHRKDFEIRFESELRTKLQRLYDQGVERGRVDIYKEMEKLGSNRKRMAMSKQVTNRVDKLSSRLLTRIKQVVEDKMQAVTMEWIGKEGGIYPVVLGIEEKLNRQIGDLSAEIEAGYTDGRADAMKEVKDEIEEYVYTAVLDKNLCDNCAPLDGATFTDAEWKAAGLNDSKPVNPDCLGGIRCRCQKVPYKLDQYFARNDQE
jgi:hypothetical protein